MAGISKSLVESPFDLWISEYFIHKTNDKGILIMNIDHNRAKECADLLFQSFQTIGIHGHTRMPEDLLPKDVTQGSLEHILFITLSVSIDYQRDANVLWDSSRDTFQDPETNYLFNLEVICKTSQGKVERDMQKYKLSRKPKKDALIWSTVAKSFFEKWGGDPRILIKNCGWDGVNVLSRLKGDFHNEGRSCTPDFPYLRGSKIGPLWLRMLRDNAGVDSIKNLDKIPIPVDIHVARASLALGVLQGQYRGKLNNLFEEIRNAWFLGVKGLRIGSRDMIALDVDEPLWVLSKYGCTDRNKNTGECPHFSKCEMKDYCIPGKIAITNGFVEMNT